MSGGRRVTLDCRTRPGKQFPQGEPSGNAWPAPDLPQTGTACPFMSCFARTLCPPRQPQRRRVRPWQWYAFRAVCLGGRSFGGGPSGRETGSRSGVRWCRPTSPGTPSTSPPFWPSTIWPVRSYFPGIRSAGSRRPRPPSMSRSFSWNISAASYGALHRKALASRVW